MSKNIRTVSSSRKGRIVEGVDPKKKTTFLPHTIQDNIKRAAKNVSSFVKGLSN